MGDGLSIQKIAELSSLGLTFPTVVLAVFVAITWRHAAIAALKKQSMNHNEYFILGVTIGFVGQTFDNLYWFFPWSAFYIGHPIAGDLTAAGVFFNIISRQGCGIFAAYCHMKAAALSNTVNTKVFNNVVAASWIAGAAYPLILLIWWT